MRPLDCSARRSGSARGPGGRQTSQRGASAMRVGILAGGMGSRLAEETETKPKPMVEISGKPILWHIIQGYVHAGFDQFVVALGYKGDHIKRWMIDCASLTDDITVD